MSSPDALLPAWRHLVPHARRVEIRHIRARTFRFWGVVETALYVVGFLILLPFIAVLVLFSGGDGGADGGGGDGGRRAARPGPEGARRRWGDVSRFWRYHHDVELRVVDGRGQALVEQRERPANAELGRRLFTDALRWADAHRLIVEERITPDEHPHTASVLIARWFGGRPLLSGPDLRQAEALERDLEEAGFAVERGDGRVLLRRTVRPHVGEAWGSLAALAAISAIAVFTALPFAVVIGVVVAGWALLHPLEVARLVVRHLFALSGVPERHELVITPNAVTYRRGHLKLITRGSTEGERLIAAGYTESLGWDRTVSHEDLQLRFLGENRALVIPADLTRGVGALVSEWAVSTLLSLRQQTEVHDFRSACAYCGSLYDWDVQKACPQCGGTRLDRLR